MIRILPAIAFFAALPCRAWAADTDPISVFPAVLKVTGSMVIILGLILLFYYLSRKGMTLFPTSRDGALKVVETRYIMPKKAVSLVNVRGREFLVGVGNDRVELLTKVDWNSPPPTSTFDENLEESLTKKRAEKKLENGAEKP